MRITYLPVANGNLYLHLLKDCLARTCPWSGVMKKRSPIATVKTPAVAIVVTSVPLTLCRDLLVELQQQTTGVSPLAVKQVTTVVMTSKCCSQVYRLPEVLYTTQFPVWNVLVCIYILFTFLIIRYPWLYQKQS